MTSGFHFGVWLFLFHCCFHLQYMPISAQETIACGGYIKHNISTPAFTLDFSRLSVQLSLPDGSLSYSTDVLPNGAYSMPIYDNGKYSLTLDVPQGWVFEPVQGHEIHVVNQDSCKPNFNFYFVGFAVNVKVQTKGAASGPSGLKISIQLEGQPDGTAAASCVTNESGSCPLERIPPGKHMLFVELDATNAAFQFTKARMPVVVKNDVVNAEPFIIKGFHVGGSVSSNNQPIKNVYFQLFSKTIPKSEIDFAAAECDPAFKPTVANAAGVGTPLCQTASKADGKFHFALLPAGEYTLIPYYHDDNIVFDVKPEKLQFTVSNGILDVGRAFEVAGFSLYGNVYLNDKDKTPVKGAKVVVNEQWNTLSDDQGRYKLVNMHFTDYSIRVFAENLEFPEQKISLTPPKPSLPNIFPTKFAVCGKIALDKVLEANHISGRSVVFLSAEAEKEILRVQTHNSLGEFCGLLVPAEYIVRPVVSKEEEDNLGLRLAPLQIAVTVLDKPIFGLKFSQFRATLNGKITCLESCLPGVWEVTLRPETAGSLSRITVQQPVIQYIKINKATPLIGEFQFNNVLPGPYKLYLHPAASNGDLPPLNAPSEPPGAPNWCWREKEMPVLVEDKNIDNLEFLHEGYQLTVSSTHDMVLHYKHQPEQGNQSTKTTTGSSSKVVEGKWTVQPGSVKLCVPSPGKYQLKAESCHRLEQTDFTYQSQHSLPSSDNKDNNNIGLFQLRAKEHQVNIHFRRGLEKQATPIDDVTVAVTYDNMPDRNFKKAIKLKNVDSKQPSIMGADIALWIPLGVNVNIVPSSAVGLFTPDSVTISAGSGAECLPTVATIEVQRGVFVTGAVDPAMPDVDVILYTGDVVFLQTVTDKQGKFQVGPLKPQAEELASQNPYRVEIKKDGYEFTLVRNANRPAALTAGDYYFAYKSNKLAEVVVNVLEEDSDQPIPGVLISIVGDEYRNSEHTAENGKIVFLGLIPGTFYIRAMMKEYDFQPAGATAVKVEEGKRVVQTLRGKRSAYSIFGQVNSLNGQSESNILVEAKEIGPVPGVEVTPIMKAHCSLDTAPQKRRIEQTTTNEMGKFRLRGLLPGCQYSVYMKLDHPSNQNLDRTVPPSVLVSMQAKDYYNISIIAFRRINMMQVTAYVHTEDTYLRSLYLVLYPSNNPDHVLKRHNFATDSIYFIMNGLALSHSSSSSSASASSNGAGAAAESGSKNLQEATAEWSPRQYVLRLESVLSPSLYDNVTAQEITFSATYDSHSRLPGYQQKHFEFFFHPVKKPTTDQEVQLNVSSALTLPLLLVIVATGYVMRDFLRVLQQSFFQRLQSFNITLPTGRKWIRPTRYEKNLEMDPKVVQSLNSFVMKRPGSVPVPVKKPGFWTKSKKA